MALKDNWIDRQNGIDDVDSEDINKVARAVIELEENANKNVVDQTFNPTSENAQSGKAVAEAVTTEEKRADNTFANALKGSKSGSAILIDDVSPVTHNMGVKISSDTVTDLTVVKVSRCGKNLLNLSNREIITRDYSSNTDVRNFNGNQLFVGITSNNYFATPNIVSYSIGETITVTAKQSAYGLGCDVAVEPNTSYVFSSITTNGEIRAGLYNKDGMFSRMINDGSHFTTNSNEYWAIIILKPLAGYESIGVSFSDIQIELGATATDYEPYKECAEYTPSADGTVNGVTSLYPNTTLMTDAEGVLIDCEYNKDINKAFAALEAAIATNNS